MLVKHGTHSRKTKPFVEFYFKLLCTYFCVFEKCVSITRIQPDAVNKIYRILLFQNTKYPAQKALKGFTYSKTLISFEGDQMARDIVQDNVQIIEK